MAVDGIQIHNYKGDCVNSLDITQREPQPDKLKEGYFNSVVTHNYLATRYGKLYTSHEGLVLPYEAAMTRQIGNEHYCLSAHLIWIG